LSAIEKAGGSIELAGANADSLLVNSDDGNSAASAVSTWCRGTKAILCTYDGAEEEKRRSDLAKSADERGGNEDKMIRSSIRVAAREAVGVAGAGVSKIAILSAGEEIGDDEVTEQKGKGFLGGLFGGNAVEIPDTMSEAMQGATAIVRHGELFGAPESSPESSPFMGGPRREPVLREMYTMRSIRIDPTISLSGNVIAGGSKTNRVAVGAVASRLGMGKIDVPKKSGIDVSLSSFAGTETPSEAEWNKEFSRVMELISSPSGGANLFSAEFSSVPSTKRLAEWIATKWAPAILRSYDIAGTRVGARPVYAVQTDDNTVEIVWQELVNFNSVTSGRMIIKIEDTGITATRGPGNAADGFGRISMKPLSGEDILVRRLADAASQAIEKGLATKSKVSAKESTAQETQAKPLTTLVATSAESAPAEPAAPAMSGPGPRGAGVRRSAERTRGSRRKSPPASE